MRGLIRRTPECALHVHVGLPSPEAAVAASTGLREALPLIMGLGASSPFWFGLDSGLASARSAMRGYPGRGAPPPLRTWDDYLEQLDAIAAGGGPTDRTMVWWDVQLQPRLGTVGAAGAGRPDQARGRGGARGARSGACRTGRRAAGGRAVSGAGDRLVVVSSLPRRLAGDDRPRGPAGFGARGRPGDGCPPRTAGAGSRRRRADARRGARADRQRAPSGHGGMAGLLQFLAEETARPADAESSAA